SVLGHTTLRDAITQANTLGGQNTIEFSVQGTISLNASLGSLEVKAGTQLMPNDLTIDGLEGNAIKIDGNHQVGIFKIDAGATVEMLGLDIANGKSNAGAGGIINRGNLTVSNSTIEGNSGGGIYNSGTLTLNDDTIQSNSTSNSGGGIN